MNNVHFAIPEIYGETLSYYELLRKLVNKMNELIENYNTVPDQIAEAVANLDESQLFSAVLNQLIHSIATDNTKSANAVKVYKKHDLLYATFNETVNLYESLIDFTSGAETELIVGSNIREVSISELFIELRKLIEDETKARTQADQLLQTNIDNEAQAREQADNRNSEEITTMRNEIDDLKNFVTPEMFGAVGDGVNDDTDAIQSAINSGKPVMMGGKIYRISRKLLLPYSFDIRGVTKSSTVIKWIGSSCDYMAKTPDYSVRDTQNVYGTISDITFECETNFMSNDTVGLYFCEPNVKLIDIVVRIGEETPKAVNNNVVGICLDGCTNASPSLLEKVSVHANANIGIYVRSSHTVLISCDTAYCKNGCVIDDDTLKTDANPPYNTVFIGQHSFYDQENAILINKAKNVYVQSVFSETTGAFIHGNDSFTGELIVDASFQITYNKVNAPNASVIFRDLQNCVEYRNYRGVNSHPCYYSSFSTFEGAWGAQNGDWIIATTDKISNVVNIVDAYIEFIGSGAGNVTVELCRSDIPKQIGNYSGDDSVVVLESKTFTASGSPKLEQIRFILTQQNYVNKYIFVRLRCTDYYTNSNKKLALNIYS